jgi:hypothetical protein
MSSKFILIYADGLVHVTIFDVTDMACLSEYENLQSHSMAFLCKFTLLFCYIRLLTII